MVWTEQDEASVQKLLRHFREIDPLVLTTIKGHLFLEEKLNETIERLVTNPGVLPKVRLSFSQKLQMVRAMAHKSPDDKMWTVMVQLNKLRNAVAHNIDPQSRTEYVERLRTVLPIEDLVPREKGDVAFLQTVVAYCVGYLTTLRDENAEVLEVLLNPPS